MKILERRKIWDLENIIAADGGPPSGGTPGGEIHPDLIRYRGYWYCGLKERAHPHGIPGRARIIRSADGETWESVKRIEWANGYVSDLKFAITAEGALMVYTMVCDLVQQRFGPPIPRDPEHPELGPIKRVSVSWLTTDGLDWGTVFACPTGISTTRYAVTWQESMGYSLAYSQKDEHGTLYRTHDGKMWHAMARNVYDSWKGRSLSPSELEPGDQRLIHAVQQGGRRVVGVDVNNLAAQHPQGGFEPKTPSESALAFEADGTAVALTRCHPVFAILGTAPAPFYDPWTWKETRVDWDGDGNLRPAGERLGVQFGGPVLTRLSDGRLIAAGRCDASTEAEGLGRLTLFEVDVGNAVLKRLASLDGYSHYPGIVEHEGRLWITCGKQQRADLFGVYLLKLDLPECP